MNVFMLLHRPARRHLATWQPWVGALVALAHTTGAIKAPPRDGDAASRFEEVGRVSGLEMGLHTRWSRDESDFEVVVLRRTH